MYTTSKIGDSKMNVNELIKKYELQILEQNGKRGVHACKNQLIPISATSYQIWKRSLSSLTAGNPKKIMLTKSVRKKINAIEGLQEIRNAIDEIDCYKSEFDRVWESGESVYPSKPKVDVAA